VEGFRKSSPLYAWIKIITSHLPGENRWNKVQEKDLFTEWTLCGPQEQKKMIDEYVSASAEACSRERF